MQTINKTSMSDNIVMADTTLLRGIGRINIDNSATFSSGFVINKALELPKTPFMNPLIVFCGSPNIVDVFHHDNASIRNAINYSLAYVMVSPSHKMFPSATKLFKMSFGRFCSFALKFANQSFVLNPETFDLFSKEHLGRCYCELIYSDIDAKNSFLDVRASDIDIFGECEQEKAFALPVNLEKALSNIPRKIFLVTFWDCERYFHPSLNCAYTQNIILEGSRTREVVSHRTTINNRLGFSLLDHSTSLLNASNSELRLQTNTSKMLIGERMKLNIIPNLEFPSIIDTELQTSRIDFESINYLLCCNNLDFSCCSDIHTHRKEQEVFKTIGGWQFLSTINCGVSLPYAL